MKDSPWKKGAEAAAALQYNEKTEEEAHLELSEAGLALIVGGMRSVMGACGAANSDLILDKVKAISDLMDGVQVGVIMRALILALVSFHVADTTPGDEDSVLALYDEAFVRCTKEILETDCKAVRRRRAQNANNSGCDLS